MIGIKKHLVYNQLYFWHGLIVVFFFIRIGLVISVWEIIYNTRSFVWRLWQKRLTLQCVKVGMKVRSNSFLS